MINDENKEKLRWYMYDATPSEFNGPAVDDIIDNMKLRSKITSEISCEEMHVRNDAQEISRITPKPKIKPIGAVTGFVAAAAILALTIIGVSKEPLQADPETGFFHKLESDGTGETHITNPQALPNYAEAHLFNNEPKLSKEDHTFFRDLQSIFFIPHTLPDDFVMASFGSSQEPGEEYFSSRYVNDLNKNSDYKYLDIGVESDITMPAGLSLQYKNMLSDMEVSYYKIPDVFYRKPSDVYYLMFVKDQGLKFYVKGSVDLPILEQTMSQYIEFLRNNRHL